MALIQFLGRFSWAYTVVEPCCSKSMMLLYWHSGFILTFVSGLFACKGMINLVKKTKLVGFAIYCAAVGSICIIYPLISFQHVILWKILMMMLCIWCVFRFWCYDTGKEERFVKFKRSSSWNKGVIFIRRHFWLLVWIAKYVVPKGFTRVLGALSQLADNGVSSFF